MLSDAGFDDDEQIRRFQAVHRADIQESEFAQASACQHQVAPKTYGLTSCLLANVRTHPRATVLWQFSGITSPCSHPLQTPTFLLLYTLRLATSTRSPSKATCCPCSARTLGGFGPPWRYSSACPSGSALSPSPCGSRLAGRRRYLSANMLACLPHSLLSFPVLAWFLPSYFHEQSTVKLQVQTSK